MTDGAILILPLYMESVAAKMIGLATSALQAERRAGRITYRKVAGQHD